MKKLTAVVGITLILLLIFIGSVQARPTIFYDIYQNYWEFKSPDELNSFDVGGDPEIQYSFESDDYGTWFVLKSTTTSAKHFWINKTVNKEGSWSLFMKTYWYAPDDSTRMKFILYLYGNNSEEFKIVDIEDTSGGNYASVRTSTTSTHTFDGSYYYGSSSVGWFKSYIYIDNDQPNHLLHVYITFYDKQNGDATDARKTFEYTWSYNFTKLVKFALYIEIQPYYSAYIPDTKMSIDKIVFMEEKPKIQLNGDIEEIYMIQGDRIVYHRDGLFGVQEIEYPLLDIMKARYELLDRQVFIARYTDRDALVQDVVFLPKFMNVRVESEQAIWRMRLHSSVLGPGDDLAGFIETDLPYSGNVYVVLRDMNGREVLKSTVSFSDEYSAPFYMYLGGIDLETGVYFVQALDEHSQLLDEKAVYISSVRALSEPGLPDLTWLVLVLVLVAVVGAGYYVYRRKKVASMAVIADNKWVEM